MEFFEGDFNCGFFLEYFFEAWDGFDDESSLFDFVDDPCAGLQS